jgi:hypothetical protein
MNTPSRAAAAALTAGVLALACVLVGLPIPAPAGDDKLPAEKDPPGKDVFDLTRVWNLRLEIPAKEYEAMQPAPGGFGFPGGPGAPPPPPREKKDKRDSERNLFGTEFPWVPGDLTADGKTYTKVGIRYAGDIT